MSKSMITSAPREEMRLEQDGAKEGMMPIVSPGTDAAANPNDRHDLQATPEAALFTGSEPPPPPRTNQNHQEKIRRKIEWIESNDGRKVVNIDGINFDREYILRIGHHLRILSDPENWGLKSTNASPPSSNAPPNPPSSSIVADDPQEHYSQESLCSNTLPAPSQSAPPALAQPDAQVQPHAGHPRRPGCKGRPMCSYCRKAKRGLPCTKTPCDSCIRRGLPCSVRTWPDGRTEPSEVMSGTGVDPTTTFTIPANGAADPEVILNWLPLNGSEQQASEFQFNIPIHQPPFDVTWEPPTFDYHNGNDHVLRLVPDVNSGVDVPMVPHSYSGELWQATRASAVETNEPLEEDTEATFDFWRTLFSDE